MLKIKEAAACRYDLVSLGECMIRLSPPGRGRIEFASTLEVWVGGGEYNVAYAAARLGLRTGWVGGLNDSPLGRIVANHARAVGMDVSHAPVHTYDGVGRNDRVGLNFTEVGSGKRGSLTLYDRGHSATANLRPGEVDWRRLFNEEGVRWLHTGGIFTALSDSTRQVVAEALKAARDAGTVVSYDLNFRSSLWSTDQAAAATKPLVPYIDCLIGNEWQLRTMLGYGDGSSSAAESEFDTAALRETVNRVVKDHGNVKAVGATLRGETSASRSDWSAVLWTGGRFYDGPTYDDLEIEDRIGGGDAFASALAYGFLTGRTPQESVDLGVAHGALLMSTRGDTSQITSAELLDAAGGGSVRIKR